MSEAIRNGKYVEHLYPEKRIYNVQRMPMTEAAISPGFTRDLYVSVGEPLPDGAWAVRLHVKPFVDWIWFGCLLMALGGLIAVCDRRYRRFRRRPHCRGWRRLRTTAHARCGLAGQRGRCHQRAGDGHQPA